MEPLTFKGRRGSGIAGDRCAYADASLKTRWDFQKYEYSYRLWGRLLYNPNAEPDTWRRFLRKNFSVSAGDLEKALANASRILPLITTTHLPSAANNNYWPEMYTNHSLFDAENRGSYSDTPVPRVFGNVSPLDPQLFYRINDYADDLLSGEVSGKYSPLEVAQWLDEYVEAARQSLSVGIQKVQGKEPSADFKRLVSDVLIQMGLGRFFAAKFRSAVLYRIFEKTGERHSLELSLDQYRKARDHWAEFANIARNVYMSDVTVGELPQLHGHWADRLAAIERDIEAVAEKLEATKPGTPQASVSPSVSLALKKVLGPNERSDLPIQHVTPKHFLPGKPLILDLKAEKPVSWAKLYYRHVNQAERFNVVSMQRNGSAYEAAIPGDYTNSAYPLQYYFELNPATSVPTFYPGFSKTLTNQPYFVVRRG